MTICFSNKGYGFTCHYWPPKQPRTTNTLLAHLMRLLQLHSLYTRTQTTPFKVFQYVETLSANKTEVL